MIGSEEHPFDTIDEELITTKVTSPPVYICYKFLFLQIQYCEEHLNLLSILSPGFTENRAHMAFHYAETLDWSLKRSLLGCATEEVVQLIRENLKIVVETFGGYKLGSSEKDKSQEAESFMRSLLKDFVVN